MSGQYNSNALLDHANQNASCSICSLANLCLPRGLNQQEIEGELDLVDKYKYQLEKDEPLFRAGDDAILIYAVRTGSFKTAMSNSDGSEQITGFYFPGDLVGLDGLGSNTHTCTTIALETSAVCGIPLVEFDQLCANNSGLQHHVMHLIGNELSRNQLRLLILGQMSAEDRFSSFLVDISRHYQEQGYSPNEFNLTMTRREIANYLGLAPESLSRLLAVFQDKGILEINYRNIKILEWGLLHKWDLQRIRHR